MILLKVISTLQILFTLLANLAKSKNLIGTVAIVSNGPGELDPSNDLIYLDAKDYQTMFNQNQGSGSGYLIPQGSRMMFNLGGELRKNWADLLGTTYT